MGKLLAVFMFALAIGPVQPALANWQFTKWGMTPEQIIAASGGRAKSLPNPEIVGSEMVMVTMPYTAGEFGFRAGFYFTGNRLSEVQLDLQNGTMSAIRVSLEQKYGEPFKKDVWHSEQDEIILFPIGETSGFVAYRPLANANNSGL